MRKSIWFGVVCLIALAVGGCATVQKEEESDSKKDASYISLTETINAMNLAALNGYMDICNDPALKNRKSIPYLYEMSLSFDSEAVREGAQGLSFVWVNKKTFSSSDKFDTTLTFNIGKISNLPDAIKALSNNKSEAFEPAKMNMLVRESGGNIHVDSLRERIVSTIKSVLLAELNDGTKWQKMDAGIFVKFVETDNNSISFKAFDQVELSAGKTKKVTDTMSIRVKLDIAKTDGFMCSGKM